MKSNVYNYALRRDSPIVIFHRFKIQGNPNKIDYTELYKNWAVLPFTFLFFFYQFKIVSMSQYIKPLNLDGGQW
jgi:hypothetical protein